jgi:uncharacterized DUF497 family protein
LYYTLGVAVDWEANGQDAHIAAHGITPGQANEALDDPDAVEFDPDYNSKSGQSIRTIGYSASYGDVLSVITVRDDEGVIWGATAFRSNSKDRRYYRSKGAQ